MLIFQDELKRLQASLDTCYRGIQVTPIVTKSNEIDEAFLKELLIITSWLKSHSEVKFLHCHFEVDQLINPTFDSLNSLNSFRILLLNLAKDFDTIACTLLFSGGGNFKLYWAEFLSLFDEVVLSEKSEIEFNHSLIGMVPIIPTDKIINSLGIRKADILIPKKCDLNKTNITVQTDEKTLNYVKGLKKIIFKQSELAKLQTNLALSSPEKHQEIFNANLLSEDWRNKDFKKLRELKNDAKMKNHWKKDLDPTATLLN